jgi:hypothetical protein
MGRSQLRRLSFDGLYVPFLEVIPEEFLDIGRSADRSEVLARLYHTFIGYDKLLRQLIEALGFWIRNRGTGSRLQYDCGAQDRYRKRLSAHQCVSFP